MKRRLKIDGFLSAALAITLVVLTRLFYRPKSKVLDYSLDILGMLMVILGQILRISGRNYKKEYSEQSVALITDGPYALVRNPMYLGTFLMGCGFILILWPWWFLFIFALIFYLRFKNLVLSEENKLQQIFGKSYQQYVKTAPRFIPQPSKLIALPRYLPLKWAWIKRESPVILTWFVLLAVIEGLVDEKNFTSLEYLKELMVLGTTLILGLGFFIVLLMRNGAKKRS